MRWYVFYSFTFTVVSQAHGSVYLSPQPYSLHVAATHTSIMIAVQVPSFKYVNVYIGLLLLPQNSHVSTIKWAAPF